MTATPERRDRQPLERDAHADPSAAFNPEHDIAWIHQRVTDWFVHHGRDLPWRHADCSPWGIFVSEIMAQQTPIARIEAPWREWMTRWPTPAHLAAAAPGDAVRLWGRLGYPRRALRLHDAARAMVERHGGEVPDTVDELLALPGVGAYTAAAVACFAYAVPAPVVDTNVRRVLARAHAQAAPSLTADERARAAAWLPADPAQACVWNVAVMELGALVCTARSPSCHDCPVAPRCRWLGAGRPAYEGPHRPKQTYAGTDRQARGVLLAGVRDRADRRERDLPSLGRSGAEPPSPGDAARRRPPRARPRREHSPAALTPKHSAD